MEPHIHLSKVEALITTYNNLCGLNTLIWCILLGTEKPGAITIINTGEPLADLQLVHTLNFAASEMTVSIRNIPNDRFFVGGEFHLGLLRKFSFEIAQKEYVWLFDDDIVITPHCLSKQRLHPLPNIPRNFDPSHKVSEMWEPELYTYHYAQCPTRIKKGCLFGLLVKLDELLAIPNLEQVSGMEDSWIIRHLKPLVVTDGTSYHTRPAKPRFSAYGSMIEGFLTGRLVPPKDLEE